jgi:hypothetical protein
MFYFIIFLSMTMPILGASFEHARAASFAPTSSSVTSSSSMMNSMKSGYNSALKSVKSTYQSLVGKPLSGKSSAGSSSENSLGMSLEIGPTSQQTAIPIVHKPVVPSASIDLSHSGEKSKPTSLPKSEKTSFTKTVSSKAKEVFESIGNIDLNYRTNAKIVKNFVSGAVGSIPVGVSKSSSGKEYGVVTLKNYSINRHNAKLDQQYKELDLFDAQEYEGMEVA